MGRLPHIWPLTTRCVPWSSISWIMVENFEHWANDAEAVKTAAAAMIAVNAWVLVFRIVPV